MDDAKIRLKLTGDFELSIGSDPQNDVLLPDVAPFQAKLRRKGDRIFLKALGTDNRAILINRNVARINYWTEVTRYDEIVIAGTILSISPKFFLGRDRVSIDTSPLSFVLPGRPSRILVSGPFFRAKPGTFTAIMGPAGSGKTLLLNMLTGYLVPTSGRIVIGDGFEPHRDHGILRDFIGYVPQDDVLIPELTVRQSLMYRLELKFPDMELATKKRLIMETCRQMGLKSNGTDDFLDTMIGEPEGPRRGLSGGERKRANIAHELITKPLILMLDEPTSGLSSADAEQIVLLLHRLAKEDSLTIIASVHQPSAHAYELFDNLMVLGYGGRLAYYGPAKYAVEFFEDSIRVHYRGTNPAEYILDHVTRASDTNVLAARFEEARTSNPRLPLPLESNSIGRLQQSAKSKFPKEKPFAWLAQWSSLIRRNLRVLWTDKISLSLGVLQAPLIGFMIFAAFQGVMGDAKESDNLARAKYYFDLAKAEYESRNTTVPTVERLWKNAKAKAAEDSRHYGVQTANRLAAIYFALVAASIWFGTLGSCREIVGEQRILRRELRSCMTLMPFLGSKGAVQLFMTGLQSALLVLTIYSLPFGVRLTNGVKLWGVLWLVSASAAALGILVSSLSPTLRTALTAVPVLMIPQLLFGGILRPGVDINGALIWPRVTSSFTIQHYGFQLALEAVSKDDTKVLIQEVNLEDSGRYSELNILNFRETELARLYFPPSQLGNILAPVLFLAGSAFLFFIASYIALRIRFL